MEITEITTATVNTSEMAAKVAESADVIEDTIKLVTGAVVRVHPMKDRVAFKLYQLYPEPKPPVVHISQNGKEWDEANPNDPYYLAAKEKYRVDTYQAYMKLVLMTCIEIVSLPEGMPDFEKDTEWLEEYAALGFSTEFSNRLERRLEWLTYRIIVSNADMSKIQDLSTKLSGVTDEQLKAAEATFSS